MNGETSRRRGPIAYVMSRFPKLTETFILFEILALEEQGVDVRVYPLLRARQGVAHPEAAPIVARARYLPFLSATIIATNVGVLVRRPRAYLGALATLVRETLGSPNYLFGGLAMFPKVVQMAIEMERAGIRHVHCHFSNHPATAGFVIHRLTGIPYSFTAHGSDLHVDRHMLCAKTADAAFTVAISEFNRRVIQDECGVATRVEVIHTGVDTQHFAPARKAGTVRKALSIVMVGTLHEVKGQAHLIEACRIAHTAGVELECRIVGDGSDARRLRRLIGDAGLAGRVRLVGPKPRSEVAALLREADVLVAPSVPTRSGRREGIPVVIMEAMASGLPVVASRLSGIPELVEDGRTGILVVPGDAHAIADALIRLHQDPSLAQRLGAEARRRVLDEFDVGRNAARLAVRIFAGMPDSIPPAMASRRLTDPGRSSRRRSGTVALVGPDGAGKTTIARRLHRELPIPTAYAYMGVNPESGNHLLPTTRLVAWARRRLRGADDVRRAGASTGSPAPRPGSMAGGLRAGARLANRLAEEFYRQLIAEWQTRRGRLVIFDRHYYLDFHAADIADRDRPLHRRLHGAVLQHLYPKPDLVLYLDAPAATLLARKGEGTLESLERMRGQYLAAGQTLPAFEVIDATLPEAELVRLIGARLLAFAHADPRAPIAAHAATGGRT